MRLGALITRQFTVAMLIAFVAARAGAAQQPASLPATTLALIESLDAGAVAQLATVARGGLVVRELPTRDRDEVALLGLVTVDAPRSFYLTAVAGSSAVVAPPTRTEFGTFGRGPSGGDLAAYTLSRSDARALRDCRPLHCPLKLPAGMMAALSQAATVGAADSLVREWLAGVVRAYAAGGDSALPVYDDTRLGERAAEGAARLLAEDSTVLRSAPELAAYLAGAPDTALTGVTTRLYWSVDRPSGLAPILSAMQLSTYAGADPATPSFVVSKQIYADHYFDARLDVAALTDATPAGTSTFVVFVRRVRFDHLVSGGLFDLRGRVVRKLRGALTDELTQAKRAVEEAYRARPTP